MILSSAHGESCGGISVRMIREIFFSLLSLGGDLVSGATLTLTQNIIIFLICKVRT